MPDFQRLDGSPQQKLRLLPRALCPRLRRKCNPNVTHVDHTDHNLLAKSSTSNRRVPEKGACGPSGCKPASAGSSTRDARFGPSGAPLTLLP